MAHPWHPADIKAAIEKRGSSLAQIARDAGLHPRTIASVLRQPYYAGEQAVAAFLGVEAHRIWPDRYDAHGQPRHPRIRCNGSNGVAKTNLRQNAGAA